MNLIEQQLSGETYYHGRIIDLRVDRVRLPDGGEATREVIDHPGGVGVVALTDRDEVLFVRQFRYPYREVLLEIPAGKRDRGEDPLATGKRELREETGAAAAHYEPLGVLYPSPGYCAEVIHLFLATGLTFGETRPDDDEFLEPDRIPLEEAVKMVLAGEIKDAKTQVALLKVALLRQTGAPGHTGGDQSC